MNVLKIIFLFLFMLQGQKVMASFVNSCFLKGTITNEPKRDAKGVWSFEFAVKSSEKYGRTDSGCHDEGKTISVSIDLVDAKRALNKGESLHLNKFEKKNNMQDGFTTYSIIQE